MGLFNLAPYFIILAMICAVFSLGPFRFLDSTESEGSRVSTIDGLRGFLALSVMLYHGLINFNLVSGNGWHADGKLFYNPLGGVAVMFFFMITAFLFWGRLLRSSGMPDWRSLYVNRLFRIGPLYIFAVVVMTFIVFWRSGFRLNEPVLELSDNLAHWLSLGMDDSTPPINAYPWTPFILMGVTWSIRYEWWFYFSLIVLAKFVRSHVAFSAIGLIASLMVMMKDPAIEWSCIAAFFSGMLSASLLHEGIRPRLSDPAMSTISLFALALLFSFALTHAGVPQIVLMAIVFYFICSGASFFGILQLRGAERLGHISYGIYLLQGIPMNLFFSSHSRTQWAIRSPANYWLSLLVCAFLLCLVASITHILIEKPFISLGKKLGRGKSQRGPSSIPSTRSERGALHDDKVSSHKVSRRA